MKKIAVFVSGRGSNLRAIYKKSKERNSKFIIEYVFANKHCEAIDFAKENGIKTKFVSNEKNSNSLSFFDVLNLLKNNVDLIALAGFLKKIPDYFVKEFENKIINIHPALLPFFGGKGMYGINVHNAVFESAMKISGATVHFVNEEFDKGYIIFQKSTDISKCNSPEEIAKEVLKIEHEILPYVIEKFINDEIYFQNNRVYLR